MSLRVTSALMWKFVDAHKHSEPLIYDISLHFWLEDTNPDSH